MSDGQKHDSHRHPISVRIGGIEYCWNVTDYYVMSVDVRDALPEVKP